MVSAGVIILRRQPAPNFIAHFRGALVPWAPDRSDRACLWLMLNLDRRLTWIRFVVWMGDGMVFLPAVRPAATAWPQGGCDFA